MVKSTHVHFTCCPFFVMFAPLLSDCFVPCRYSPVDAYCWPQRGRPSSAALSWLWLHCTCCWLWPASAWLWLRHVKALLSTVVRLSVLAFLTSLLWSVLTTGDFKEASQKVVHFKLFSFFPLYHNEGLHFYLFHSRNESDHLFVFFTFHI